MTPDRPDAPAWQRNPLFRFFASLQLAMLLLTVLTLASIIGTLAESKFDAKVARAYIYGAAWFNVWLLLLVVNLVCSAFSRWPWKKHHFSFLITHLGIILLIAGAWIGREFGIEGTMTLFKGDPPANMLTIDQRILRVSAGEADPQSATFEILNRPPTPQNPRAFLTTPSGYQLSVVDFSPSLEMNMTPVELATGGVPAVHVSIATAMMGQKLESWLIADDPDHGVFSMGLATISLKRGTAAPSAASATPAPAAATPTQPTDIEEAIFAFANMPDQISHPEKGGATGAKVKLVNVAPGNSGSVVVEYNGSSASFDVQSNLNKDIPIPGTPFTLSIKNYWPDFRIKDGKPGTLSQDPNNPAVLVFLTGHAVPIAAVPAHAGAAATDPSGAPADAPPPMTGPPALNSGVSALNHLVLYVDDKGRLTYDLASRKAGASSGNLDPGTALPTGWADWKLTVDKFIPHAQQHFTASPAPADFKGPRSEGLRVRAVKGAESVEEWVPLGWQVALPTSPVPLQVAYGYKELPLPIGLRLTDFQVDRNEGTDSPAGFKSTVEILDGDGSSTTGQCWMNNPISYPASWINTFSGFTYKISQASWNPENLGQSTVQILRDPGWSLKWIGSLLIVAGVFSLFYLRPEPENLRRPTAAAQPAGKSKKSPRIAVEV